MPVSVVVASHNPVKIQAVQRGFEKMYPDWQLDMIKVNVSSGVSEQPLTSKETLQGAENRALAASGQVPGADYWVGIEGGLHDFHGRTGAFAWVVIRSSQGQTGKSQTGVFFLPEEVIALVDDGLELGTAIDRVFGRHNTKQQGGAVGNLTNHVIDRTSYYEHAVVLALIPFKNKSLFASGTSRSWRGNNS